MLHLLKSQVDIQQNLIDNICVYIFYMNTYFFFRDAQTYEFWTNT